MYVVPIWLLWFFLIAGFLSIGYSFFPQRNRSAGVAFVLGIISIGIAIFLWLSPNVILR
jgi:dolichyl-phosphate-mannose--protein O-mannosyl transferase